MVGLDLGCKECVPTPYWHSMLLRGPAGEWGWGWPGWQCLSDERGGGQVRDWEEGGGQFKSCSSGGPAQHNMLQDCKPCHSRPIEFSAGTRPSRPGLGERGGVLTENLSRVLSQVLSPSHASPAVNPSPSPSYRNNLLDPVDHGDVQAKQGGGERGSAAYCCCCCSMNMYRDHGHPVALLKQLLYIHRRA